jgi:hypothetical protein
LTGINGSLSKAAVYRKALLFQCASHCPLTAVGEAIVRTVSRLLIVGVIMILNDQEIKYVNYVRFQLIL